MIFADRILKNPRKRILKNIDTGDILNIEIQDDPDNIEQEGDLLNSNLFERFKEEIIQSVRESDHPIGCLFFTSSTENPKNELGFGTWEKVAKGRSIVGVDETNINFNTVEKQIGSETQALRALIGATNNRAERIGYAGAGKVEGNSYTYSIFGTNFASNISANDVNHSTVVCKPDGTLATTIQPSECYNIWKRIS